MVGGERAREQSDPRARSLAGRHRPPVSRADIFSQPSRIAARSSAAPYAPPPDHIDLTPMPPGAAALVAASAVAHCPGLEAIGGEAAAATEFASAWVGLRGGGWRVAHRWSWLVLFDLPSPPRVPGALRLASGSDWALVSAWAPLYMRDTGAPGSVLSFSYARHACAASAQASRYLQSRHGCTSRGSRSAELAHVPARVQLAGATARSTESTTRNVADLVPVWTMSTGTAEGHQAPPIVNDGVMFITTPFNQVIAIDAKTGDLLWRYRASDAGRHPHGPPDESRRRAIRRQGLHGDVRRARRRARREDR